MDELVQTRNGLKLEMQFLKQAESIKVFYCQDRVCITDLFNVEITSIDLIRLNEEVWKRYN